MKTLTSYLMGQWQTGRGTPQTLVNPTTEEAMAQCSTEGLDMGAAVRFARAQGLPALQALTFSQRAQILRALAKCLNDARDELIALGTLNAGNTRGDAKFDIDGAAATLNFYADLGAKLGESRVLPDGEGVALGRSARLFGQHVWVSRQGIAVHINAFNFPAWGMGEKLAVSLLAGIPTLSKPATSTALMAHRIAELWVESKALPEGAFQFICGSVGDLLSHVGPQDVVAFTGSSTTAETLRANERVSKCSVHLNVEADSLNCAVLGPDAQVGSEVQNLFLTDVAKEMTQKAGQKCTAVRRIFVPQAMVGELTEALVDRLSSIRVGDPADDKTQVGPLATATQARDVRAGIEKLSAGALTACGGAGVPSGLSKGYFVAPTLLVRQQSTPDDLAHHLEVFGPVATLIGYENRESLRTLVAAGGGGLVASLYSDDNAWLHQTLGDVAPFHGRVTLSTEKVAGQTVPPGTVMPMLLHGGPGRAGGGEELGGARGLELYMQRVALQGPRAFVETFAGIKSAPPASAVTP